MTPAMSSARTAAALALLACLTASCMRVSPAGESAAEDLHDDLAALPHVLDAEVTIRHELDDYEPVYGTVSLESAVTASEVAGVVTSAADLVSASGLQVEQLRVVRDGGDSSIEVGGSGSVPWSAGSAHRAARWWFRIDAMLAGSGSVAVSPPRRLEVTLDDDPADPIPGFVHRVLRDPKVSSPKIDWLVRSGGRDIGGSLAAALDVYDAAVASYELAPPGVSVGRLGVGVSGGRAVSITEAMAFDPEVDPDELTADAWGERLRPLLARQVALVDDLPRGSQLDVSHHSPADGTFFLYPMGAASDPRTQGWIDLLDR